MVLVVSSLASFHPVESLAVSPLGAGYYWREQIAKLGSAQAAFYQVKSSINIGQRREK